MSSGNDFDCWSRLWIYPKGFPVWVCRGVSSLLWRCLFGRFLRVFFTNTKIQGLSYQCPLFAAILAREYAEITTAHMMISGIER